MGLGRVLVIDEDQALQAVVQAAATSHQGAVHVTSSPAQALNWLHDASFDLVIADVSLPGIGGLAILERVRELYPATSVILTTHYPIIEDAVGAMRLGALDYLIKPICPSHLSTILCRLVSQKRSLVGKEPLPIVVASPAMQEVMKTVKRVAHSDATVFISGESGTGKEVIAHLLHTLSKRAYKPYVRVNCAAIPETLLESEFFGHERGAFTGAHVRKAGRFETADGGTILLDEVTEIPPSIQPKLLRALQEREFERVGGTQTLRVDVRVIATSNRDLQAAVREGIIREDFYYRLNVLPIHLPPLRERPEDILPLAYHFLPSGKQLTGEASQSLLAYDWPGNIRELSNVIARSSVLTDGDIIERLHF